MKQTTTREMEMEMELYATEQEAIEAAVETSQEQIAFDWLKAPFYTDDELRRANAARSVFLYGLEGSPYHGRYEVKHGEMATYGLAATRIGTAEFGTFHRLEHDATGEMAKKMMGPV